MSGPQHTLFIVEDNQAWSKQVAGLIQDRFPTAQISTAASLTDAQEVLQQNEFQVAVVDVRLDDSDESNQDGLAVAGFIRGQHSQTFICFLTGYATIELVKKAMRPSKDGRSLADDFIEKSDIPKLITYLEKLWKEEE